MSKTIKCKRKMREWTLQFLFSADVGKDLTLIDQDDINRFWEMMEVEQENELLKYPESKIEATNRILDIIAHSETIDETIIKFAKNWSLDRMLSVDRNLLRLAVHEMLYCVETPNKVALNEALEIAKSFSDIDSKNFINGVLDKVLRELEKN